MNAFEDRPVIHETCNGQGCKSCGYQGEVIAPHHLPRGREMIDDAEVRDLLEIPAYVTFRGIVVSEADHLFKDAACDDCGQPAAVVAEFTVLDRDEGFIATDAAFCASHAGLAVRCLLERSDRSIDHDTTVSVCRWAIRYRAFDRAA